MKRFSKRHAHHDDGAEGAAAPEERRDRRKGAAFFWGLLAALLAGTGSLAVASWVVSLSGGSSGQSQSGTVASLTITASAAPGVTNELTPGGSGDVVVTITNPNSANVSLTGVELPTDTTDAAAYSDSALTNPVAGCTSANSTVAWSFATGTSGSIHTLSTPLVIGANSSLEVSFTNDASMGAGAPSACSSSYFEMPALTGIVAAITAAAPTTGPATDAWTS